MSNKLDKQSQLSQEKGEKVQIRKMSNDLGPNNHHHHPHTRGN